MSTPFPLASGRYETGPGMRRFGQAGQGFPAESGHFRPDSGLARTLAAKLDVLRRAPQECHLTAPDADVRAALYESFRLLATEHPDMAAVDGERIALPHLGLSLSSADGARVIGAPREDLRSVAADVATWLASKGGIDLLGNALGLAVQEDLAIVTGAGGRLEWLHVCLPSGWSPSEKIGLPFGAVHAPVAHSGALVASSERIVRAMVEGGPFVRYVWGIHRDGELCHNPRLHQAPAWGGAPEGQAWFRVERQTTCGFPALGQALFTIRYWVEPLAETASDAYRRERLTSALAGMDAEELAYKGLGPARDKLVAWLSLPAEGATPCADG